MAKLKGRAVTPEQKKQTINQLYLLWLSAPSMRLGQLIDAAVDEGKDVFYVEDEDLIKAIAKLIAPSV